MVFAFLVPWINNLALSKLNRNERDPNGFLVPGGIELGNTTPLFAMDRLIEPGTNQVGFSVFLITFVDPVGVSQPVFPIEIGKTHTSSLFFGFLTEICG